MKHPQITNARNSHTHGREVLKKAHVSDTFHLPFSAGRPPQLLVSVPLRPVFGKTQFITYVGIKRGSFFESRK